MYLVDVVQLRLLGRSRFRQPGSTKRRTRIQLDETADMTKKGAHHLVGDLNDMRVGVYD